MHAFLPLPLRAASAEHTEAEQQSTAVAALSVFPFCKCDTYRCHDGPFRVSYLYRNQSVGEFGPQVHLVFEIQQVGEGGGRLPV